MLQKHTVVLLDAPLKETHVCVCVFNLIRRLKTNNGVKRRTCNNKNTEVAGKTTGRGAPNFHRFWVDFPRGRRWKMRVGRVNNRLKES